MTAPLDHERQPLSRSAGSALYAENYACRRVAYSRHCSSLSSLRHMLGADDWYTCACHAGEEASAWLPPYSDSRLGAAAAVAFGTRRGRSRAS